jgi:hypothetical protein
MKTFVFIAASCLYKSTINDSHALIFYAKKMEAQASFLHCVKPFKLATGGSIP